MKRIIMVAVALKGSLAFSVCSDPQITKGQIKTCAIGIGFNRAEAKHDAFTIAMEEFESICRSGPDPDKDECIRRGFTVVYGEYSCKELRLISECKREMSFVFN